MHILCMLFTEHTSVYQLNNTHNVNLSLVSLCLLILIHMIGDLIRNYYQLWVVSHVSRRSKWKWFPCCHKLLLFLHMFVFRTEPRFYHWEEVVLEGCLPISLKQTTKPICWHQPRGKPLAMSSSSVV